MNPQINDTMLRDNGDLDFLELVCCYLDDQLAAGGLADFNEQLRSNDACRQTFVRYCLQGKLLAETLAVGIPLADDTSQVTEEAVPTKAFSASSVATSAFFPAALHNTVGYLSSGWPVAYLVATVIFGIGILVGAFTYVSQPVQVVATKSSTPMAPFDKPQVESVGRIIGIADCRWATGSVPLLVNDTVPLGREFKLDSGLVEIGYNTGARVILQGPVTYEVESPNGGFMSVGKLTGKVEVEKAKGFSVRTPTATVTDLGTVFGVEVSEEGPTQVHVLQGGVEVRGSGGQGGVQRLTEGKAIEIGRNGGPIKAVAFTPQAFTLKLQPAANNLAEEAYVKAVLTDRPMGYWPLNEPAYSRKFFDRSGNGIHGYAMSEVIAGEQGPLSHGSRAIELDGNGYIDLGRHDEFAMKNGFTVEAWVWIGKVKRSGVVFAALGDGNRPNGWALCAGHIGPDGEPAEEQVFLRFAMCNVNNYYSPPLANGAIEGRWLHVAIAFDRTNTAHLYLNGEQRLSVAGASANVEPVWLTIGRGELSAAPEDVDDTSWRGRLAHVAVYPYALTAQHILNHYSQRDNGGKEVADKQP